MNDAQIASAEANHGTGSGGARGMLGDPQVVAGIGRARLAMGVVSVGVALLGLQQSIGKGRAGVWVGWTHRELFVNRTNTNGATVLLVLGALTIVLAVAPRLLSKPGGARAGLPKGFLSYGFLVIGLAHLTVAGLGLYWWGHPEFKQPKKEIPNWLAADGRTVVLHTMFFVGLCSINLTVWLMERGESK